MNNFDMTYLIKAGFTPDEIATKAKKYAEEHAAMERLNQARTSLAYFVVNYEECLFGENYSEEEKAEMRAEFIEQLIADEEHILSEFKKIKTKEKEKTKVIMPERVEVSNASDILDAFLKGLN